MLIIQITRREKGRSGVFIPQRVTPCRIFHCTLLLFIYLRGFPRNICISWDLFIGLWSDRTHFRCFRFLNTEKIYSLLNFSFSFSFALKLIYFLYIIVEFKAEWSFYNLMKIEKCNKIIFKSIDYSIWTQ